MTLNFTGWANCNGITTPSHILKFKALEEKKKKKPNHSKNINFNTQEFYGINLIP